MNKLNDIQMEEIVGGGIQQILCSSYFIGMAALIGSASVVGGIAVSALGAAVCHMV